MHTDPEFEYYDEQCPTNLLGDLKEDTFSKRKRITQDKDQFQDYDVEEPGLDEMMAGDDDYFEVMGKSTRQQRSNR